MRRVLWLLGWLWLSGFVSAEGLRLQMSPAEVQAAVGRPTSKLARGDTEVWLYPDGGRVEFHGGFVAVIKDLPTEAGEAPREEAPVVVEAPPQVEPKAAAPVPSTEPTEPRVPEVDETATDIAWMEHGPELHQPTLTENLGMLAIQAVVGLLLTMVVLKAAFKWSDIHADWSQMILPAVADMVTRTTVVLVAQYVFHTIEVFHVDHALSYLALLFTLMKTTHASSLKRAVAVAGAAKLATIVIWSLLSVALLQALYG